MSSSASDPGKGTPSLAARIDALERETANLTAALAQAQRVRFGITILLVAFVALTITLFYKQGKELIEEKNLERIKVVAQDRLNDNQKQYMAQLETLARTAGPAVTDAFYAQAKKDLPKYLQATERERNQLVQHLQDRLQVKLAERFQNSLDRQEAVLTAEFPQAENEQLHKRMMDNVAEGLQRVAKKYYGDQLKDQMYVLFGTWDLFPSAEAPGRDQASIADQLIGSLLDLVTIKLKSTEKFVETP